MHRQFAELLGESGLLLDSDIDLRENQDLVLHQRIENHPVVRFALRFGEIDASNLGAEVSTPTDYDNIRTPTHGKS